MNNTELSLTIDFQKDWIDILNQRLIKDGYSVNPNIDTCIQYFNTLRRRIESKPRKILVSQEFTCPKKYRAGIKLIRQKVKHGKDLIPHLNKIRSPGDPDPLLNDWGIHHFHLGTSIEKSGFIKRTGPLLFARVTDDNFYMLDVIGHGSWSQQRLIEIIHHNWPRSIELFKVPEGYRLANTPVTDEDIAQLRKYGISTSIQVPDGTIYSLLGGGYSVSNISLDVRVTCNCYARTIKNLENHVKENLPNLIEYLRQQGANLSSSLHFQLELKNDKAYAVELNSEASVELGPMMLQVMGKF
ncbi:MAG: hypothetical protein KME12_21415 [Trichocoleus desertorum ATA4-8-CV12]|jgi:hypothetical protein|nr:hypothetical protein [Trichocoleus desertorum ATA4-8-CV12]